jgi:kynurenine 3-monooxygenase
LIPDKKITIAGAGLAGSLLSVMLGKRGYQVTILERRPDMRDQAVESGRSINLAMSSRGINALQLAGLMDEVEPLLIPMEGRLLHLENGHQEFMPYGQRSHEVIYSVSRRDLNCLMMTAAEKAEPVEVVFNQKLELIDFEHHQLTISDTVSDQVRQESFDLLIGADGAGSRTRRAMMSVVGGHSSSEFLDHDYKELEIPAGIPDANGKGRYQIKREALHIWPRGEFMLIALPNQDGSFTVTLFMPKTGPVSFESLADSASVDVFFEKHFPDARKLIPDLQADFFANPQGPLGTVRCAPWFYEDKALILGDASHAIVPFHGQGMNAGFEDCSELIRLLDAFEDDWARVLPEFDRIRRPNADAIADMALENYVTMRSSVVDPKFQLKKELGFELERRFPDRFVPRYSMVMFHLLPYAEAFSRGKTQQHILDQLVEGVESLEGVDLASAERMILEQLPPVELD